MQKRSAKIRSEDEEEIRSQKSHYTSASKPDSSLSSKNVELCLEVEMDDEVRDLIKSPEKSPSALLDVTVIKPNGLDKYTTEKQILRSPQVKSLIASMKLDSKDKKTLMTKLFGETKEDKTEGRAKKKSCLASKKTTLQQGDLERLSKNSNTSVFSVYDEVTNIKKGHVKHHPQVYTTPRTYRNIRSMFACQNKNHPHESGEKMNEPCLCQNCAIMGLLADSQKHPFATEPMPNPMETKENIKESKFRRPSRRKSVTFKNAEEEPSTSRAHEQCQTIFNLLSQRIAELEKRVALQEEKSVPKEYFKKIITKLVNHLTKLTHYTTDDKVTISPNKHRDSMVYNKYKLEDKYKPAEKYYKSGDKYNRYYVNRALLDNTYKVPAEKEYEPRACSSSEPPPPKSPSEGLWKWGEDFLVTGRDLKSKVVKLLEETLQNLKKGFEKPEAPDRFQNDMKSFVEDLSKNLAEDMKLKSATENFMFYTPRIQNEKGKERAEKPSLIPKFTRRKGPSVKVAYVNPQLTKWPEESSVSFKIDSSDNESRKANMSEARKKQYRKQFLKILENTKTADKFKLWQSIWNQALDNCQSKTDPVSIQIPDPKDPLRQKMIHIEYTIAEMEKMLTGSVNLSQKM